MVETKHPLHVSVELHDLEPCERGEECKLWGAGVLSLADIPDSAPGCKDCTVTVTLTGVGCEELTCPRTDALHAELGKVESYPGYIAEDRNGMMTYEIDAAHCILVAAIETPSETHPQE